MAANFKVFVDGNRLPAEDINNFLAKQCVVQVDGQNDLAPLTEYGVRMAMTLDTGALWFYTDLGGWSPLEIDGLLTLDEADERYLTQLTAEGLFLTKLEGADFLTEDEIATTYLAKLTAEGLYLSQTDAEQNYLGKTEAAQTYLTQLTAQGLYITASDANNTFLTPSEANNLYLTPQDADNTYLTLVSAGQVYLRQDTASSTYQTQPSSGTFITDITAGSLFISKTDNAGTYVTSIDGGKIITGTIAASAISAGVFTGFTIQTASSGQRVVIDGTNTLKFFNSSNQQVGTLSGGSSMNYNTNGTHSLQVNGSAVVTINSSGLAFSPGTAINSNTTINGDLTANYIRVGTGYTGSGHTISGTGNFFSSAGMRANADSSSAYAEMSASGAIVRKTVDINSGTFNYAVWDRNTGSLLVGSSTSSDERLKQNISDSSLGLNFINDLRAVEFEFIEPNSEMDEGTQFGVIAQEVNAALAAHNIADNNGVVNMPNLEGNQMDYYSVNYNQIVAPLIKAVQELSAKNEELEERLAALEGGNS